MYSTVLWTRRGGAIRLISAPWNLPWWSSSRRMWSGFGWKGTYSTTPSGWRSRWTGGKHLETYAVPPAAHAEGPPAPQCGNPAVNPPGAAARTPPLLHSSGG